MTDFTKDGIHETIREMINTIDQAAQQVEMNPDQRAEYEHLIVNLSAFAIQFGNLADRVQQQTQQQEQQHLGSKDTERPGLHPGIH